MECFYKWGRVDTGIDAISWAKNIEKRGAGRFFTSMDRDGTKNGFDLELTSTISSAVNIPVIASGELVVEDFFDGIKLGGAAVLADRFP